MTTNLCFSLLVSIILTSLTTFTSPNKLPVMEGTIRLPVGVSTHGANVYHGGTKIRVITEDNQIAFSIKPNRGQKVFYILIAQADALSYSFKHKDKYSTTQTIQYRSVLNGKAYKLFRMRIIPKETSIKETLIALDAQIKNTKEEYDWYIEELRLREYDIIPDNTIVIHYNPIYVQGLKNEGPHKLPVIIIKNNIEDIDALYEQEIINLLASLDTDTIHAPTKRKININNACKQVIDFIG